MIAALMAIVCFFIVVFIIGTVFFVIEISAMLARFFSEESEEE